jgi:hypothetical protein
MSDTELTTLQELEREALVLNRQAVIAVVSALRQYREIAQTLLSGRYRDGEVDAFALSNFAALMKEIESQFNYDP